MSDKMQEIREYIEKAPGFLEYSDAYDPSTVLCEVWNMLRLATTPAETESTVEQTAIK